MSLVKRLVEERMYSGRKSLPRAMRELQLMEEEITRNQVRYWQERIDKLRINDTGALRSSIVGMVHTGPVTTIEHSFLVYGIYVCNGVAREFGRPYTDSMGREYNYSNSKGNVFSSNRGGEGTWNDGQLPFLLPGGEHYRETHGLNKPKKVGPAWGGKVAGGHPHNARDWFFRKYAAMRHVLNEMEMAAYGTAYQGMLTTAIDGLMNRTRVL